MNNRDRIIEAIRIGSQPLDDDQLAARTGISPRQTVNMICRELQQAGLLKRYPGRDGKLVNLWVAEQASRVDLPSDPSRSAQEASEQLVTEPAYTPPPGDSAEQRAAERVLLDLLGKALGVELNPARIVVPSGERVEVDGADSGKTVLVECWAHQGTPKVAQRRKVHSDALKLHWIATTIYPRPQLILCLSDELAAKPFLPSAGTWLPEHSRI